MRKLFCCLMLLFLVPAIAQAELQTGLGIPKELEAVFSASWSQRVEQYAIMECDGVENAMVLVDLDRYLNLYCYQKQDGTWQQTNYARDFCLPPRRKLAFSGDARSVTLTIVAEYAGDDEESFTFTWEKNTYLLTHYSVKRGDGTASELSMENGDVTLVETDPSRRNSPVEMKVAKNPVTDYLFQRISTNLRDGIDSSVNPDGGSFYQAFYYARQAGGFVQGPAKANIAMHPRVTDGLRLREGPDAGSRALGTFFGNVEVLVVQDGVKDRKGGLWCQVQLGNLTGYMKRAYLSFLPGDHGYEYARESLLRETVSNVSLFDSAACAKEVAGLDAGTVLQLLGMEGNCYYVRAGEQYGFVKQTTLWLEK